MRQREKESEREGGEKDTGTGERRVRGRAWGERRDIGGREGAQDRRRAWRHRHSEGGEGREGRKGERSGGHIKGYCNDTRFYKSIHGESL